MVDFNKLRKQTDKPTIINPLDIFRRLPKPAGINDLYTSQAEVLTTWFNNRNKSDAVVKLHTGGGKTLVGLLMGQSTLNELKEPVLYIVPTQQLITQTIEKANEIGILAVPYESGSNLNGDFLNSQAIMVCTYNALFNGKSKFGLQGNSNPIKVGAVILDDAHTAFSIVRDSFTLDIDNKDCYQRITELFRQTFHDSDRLGTFDDVVTGQDYSVLEVPYWAWFEKLGLVREILRSHAKDYGLVWPLLRDNLHLCHALISKTSFTITPILPIIDMFPTFAEASRRIYMSATIADDSELVRIFNADSEMVKNALTSKSLAGISERMIIIPDLLFNNTHEINSRLLNWTANECKFGAIVLVPSNRLASYWVNIAELAEGSEDVALKVKDLQERKINGPIVFANRYDGIDLPNDSCRLLVMDGLPVGTSNYEQFQAISLHGGMTINRILAQRVEQGIGRGARGAGDYCVVIITGQGLTSWITQKANFKFLTGATRAQIDMGVAITKEITDYLDLELTILKSYKRDPGWIKYHAEVLAENLDAEQKEESYLDIAQCERKAFTQWNRGHHDKAIGILQQAIENLDKSIENQMKGWLYQLAARIADNWGNQEVSEKLQQQAFSFNRNLLRPKKVLPYQPITILTEQAEAIASQFKEYHLRQGLLQRFNETVSYINQNTTANQFEQALVDLARLIGLYAERFDENGVGPDVLWLLPQRQGIIIEAKSRKKPENALSKKEHGQLLVAEKWFNMHYPDYTCVRVSVHPTNQAIKAASASDSYALTYEALNKLICDARVFLTTICQSQLPSDAITGECVRQLENSPIKAINLIKNYLVKFIEVD